MLWHPGIPSSNPSLRTFPNPAPPLFPSLMITVAHLLTQIWTLLSIYSLFHSRVWDIWELLAADCSMMLYRNYALEASWMHTNIAVKFLSQCFSFNFSFSLAEKAQPQLALVITVSVAWMLYNDVLFLEKGGICGFTLCMYADYKAALTHDTLLHGLWFSPNIRHPSAVAWGTPPLTFYSLGSLPLKTSSLHWQHSAAHDVSA